MSKLISTNPARGYEEIGAVEISSLKLKLYPRLLLHKKQNCPGNIHHLRNGRATL